VACPSPPWPAGSAHLVGCGRGLPSLLLVWGAPLHGRMRACRSERQDNMRERGIREDKIPANSDEVHITNHNIRSDNTAKLVYSEGPPPEKGWVICADSHYLNTGRVW